MLFGRLHPVPGRSPYPLPSDGVRFVGLPHYERVTDVAGVVRSGGGARRAFARELETLDAVWLFGPHPLALDFARVARRHGKPVFLGVRQDFPRYIGNRLPSRAWAWAVPLAHGLELAFRRLARTTPTVVVGDELGAKYGRGGGPVLATGFSLIRKSDVVSEEEALAKRWDGDLRLLSVGRLDPEKNPLLLPEILAGLRERCSRWRLAVVGVGPLGDDLLRRAEALGGRDAIDLQGYVPLGAELWREYRASHAFLHVSLTEGLPQVLFEAQAAGLPIVATGVGGVAAAVGHGEGGIVVPPRDATAAVEALERLRLDASLRERLIRSGLQRVRGETTDAQLDAIVEFFRASTA